MCKRSIVITGGAGFIGSHVVRLFVNKYPEYRIINLDRLTYAEVLKLNFQGFFKKLSTQSGDLGTLVEKVTKAKSGGTENLT